MWLRREMDKLEDHRQKQKFVFVRSTVVSMIWFLFVFLDRLPFLKQNKHGTLLSKPQLILNGYCARAYSVIRYFVERNVNSCVVQEQGGAAPLLCNRKQSESYHAAVKSAISEIGRKFRSSALNSRFEL